MAIGCRPDWNVVLRRGKGGAEEVNRSENAIEKNWKGRRGKGRLIKKKQGKR
jgi:hypothetical protein